MSEKRTLQTQDLIWSFIGSALSICSIGFLNQHLLPASDNVFLIGAFGASIVLLYGIKNSPLTKTRNMLLGSFISGFIGAAMQQLFTDPDYQWLAGGVAVSISLLAMQATDSVYPPGGAIALIALIGSDRIKELHYWYIVSPVMSGIGILWLISWILKWVRKQLSGHE